MKTVDEVSHLLASEGVVYRTEQSPTYREPAYGYTITGSELFATTLSVETMGNLAKVTVELFRAAGDSWNHVTSGGALIPSSHLDALHQENRPNLLTTIAAEIDLDDVNQGWLLGIAGHIPRLARVEYVIGGKRLGALTAIAESDAFFSVPIVAEKVSNALPEIQLIDAE